VRVPFICAEPSFNDSIHVSTLADNPRHKPARNGLIPELRIRAQAVHVLCLRKLALFCTALCRLFLSLWATQPAGPREGAKAIRPHKFGFVLTGPQSACFSHNPLSEQQLEFLWAPRQLALFCTAGLANWLCLYNRPPANWLCSARQVPRSRPTGPWKLGLFCTIGHALRGRAIPHPRGRGFRLV